MAGTAEGLLFEPADGYVGKDINGTALYIGNTVRIVGLFVAEEFQGRQAQIVKAFEPAGERPFGIPKEGSGWCAIQFRDEEPSVARTCDLKKIDGHEPADQSFEELVSNLKQEGCSEPTR